jgi:hypothetical protein
VSVLFVFVNADTADGSIAFGRDEDRAAVPAQHAIPAFTITVVVDSRLRAY